MRYVNEVLLDFGAGPTPFAGETTFAGLSGPGVVPVDDQVNWAELDKLPNLTTLDWIGADRGVCAVIAARRLSHVGWTDAVGDVDLSGSSLVGLRIDGDGLRRLRLPATLKTLLFQGRPVPGLHVEAPDGGLGIDLRLMWRTANRDEIRIPPGLERVTSLWLSVDGEASMTALSGLADLEKLKISFADSPSRMTDLPALGSLTALRELQIDNSYDWDPATLPDLPALREVELGHTRKPIVTAVKVRLRGSGIALCVGSVKSDRWLARWGDNPFSDWIDDKRAFGVKACEAYTKARRAIEAAPKGSPAAEAALRGLVIDLNRIEQRYSRIDTGERETACAVYDDLAELAGLDAEAAGEWLDANRHW